ncbi:MAG: hypothetical protein NPIRA02_14740 [Nitrospirales bacterium]|nr:MAG: hypothetical protein NPIRA02_14740 [Nitrospirales bacterium]
MAERVTDCPSVNDALQAVVQPMPEGALETVPFPVIETESVWVVVVGGNSLNDAVTDFAALIVTAQEPDPEHAPPQLENSQLALGEAARVTDCPSAKVALQDVVHPMPTGELETVPLPVIATESLCDADSASVLTSLEGALSFPALSYAVTAK